MSEEGDADETADHRAEAQPRQPDNVLLEQSGPSNRSGQSRELDRLSVLGVHTL